MDEVIERQRSQGDEAPGTPESDDFWQDLSIRMARVLREGKAPIEYGPDGSVFVEEIANHLGVDGDAIVELACTSQVGGQLRYSLLEVDCGEAGTRLQVRARWGAQYERVRTGDEPRPDYWPRTSETSCFLCGQEGHWKRECPQGKGKGKGKRGGKGKKGRPRCPKPDAQAGEAS